MHSIRLSTISVFLTLALSAANAISAGELAELTAELREATGVPGLGAVTVSADGIEDRAVTGVRAKGSEAAIELDDPWHLGSNGKAMTAVLAAVLVLAVVFPAAVLAMVAVASVPRSRSLARLRHLPRRGAILPRRFESTVHLVKDLDFKRAPVISFCGRSKMRRPMLWPSAGQPL